MTVDTSSLPSRVTLGVSEEVTVPLPSYAGAGLDWTAVPVTEPDAAAVRVEIGLPPAAPDGPGGEPPPMSLAPEILVVRGRAVGVASWRLRLARSFDPDHPAAEHDLIVEVTDVM
jgi:hypothetical protein